MNKNIAIQGELIGEGIQSNKLKIKGQTVKFFNVFDIDLYKYFDYQDFIDFFKIIDLPIVPILNSDYSLSNEISENIKMATIKSTLYPEVWAEGIVIRPKINSNFQSRVSFKAINPEFLLKYE